jgi:hypothetical protein
MAARVVEIAAFVACCGACSLDAIGAYEAATGGAGSSTGTSVASSGGAGAGASGSASGAGGASVSSAGGNETVGGAGGSGGVGGGSCDDHALETQVEDGLSLSARDGRYCEGDDHFSFGAWIRPEVHAGAVIEWVDTAGNKGIRLSLGPQAVVANVMTSSTKCEATSGPIPLEAWTFVSVTRTNDDLVLRVDANTTPAPQVVGCTGSLDLPRQPPVRIAKAFQGQLDDVYIECNAQSSTFDPSDADAFNGAELHFDFDGEVPWANAANDDEAAQVGSPAYPCRAP